MKLQVSSKVDKWLKEELGTFTHIQLFPKYAGLGESNKGYSLGLNFANEKDSDDIVLFETKDYTFFSNESNFWFFEDVCISLDYDEKREELLISYKEEVAV